MLYENPYMLNSLNNRLQEFQYELEKRLDGEVRSDLYARTLYSTDSSLYQVMPHSVVLPRNISDLQATAELAYKFQLPTLARGGGSSLAGQSVNEAVILDCSRYLSQIIEINPEEKWTRVQPGVILDDLNQKLAVHGLGFGPDPASSNRATLGGVVANNSTGAHSILYGMTVDHILEMDVVLSDGTMTTFKPVGRNEHRILLDKPGVEGDIYREINAILQDGEKTIRGNTPKHWRRCGGYNLDRFIQGPSRFYPHQAPTLNLAELVCGSEGTLATITSLKLALVDLPKRTGLAILSFDSLHAALNSTIPLLESKPSAIELLDHLSLTLSREVPAYARVLSSFVIGTPYCLLIVEFNGETDAELRHKISALQRIVQQEKIECGFSPILEPVVQANVWKVRKVGLGLIMSGKGDQKPIPFIEDAAVPPEHLAKYIIKLEEYCHQLGVQITYYAHASAGCLHVRPLINTKAAEEIARMPDIARFSMELVGQYGGALSSEHGDGRTRSWLNQQFFGPELYKLYERTKNAFDPNHLLNPGNIVNSPPMTIGLRYGESYSTIPVKEHLDFSTDLGFARAIELCNGAGVCRKVNTGTMCPSYMVTLEEEHSTRGRANLLRAALSDRIEPAEFTSPRMYGAMDLCIECKACKAECPSSVDMAKIKFEFLAHYYEAHSTPFRARFFGAVPAASKWLSGPVAPFVNAALTNPIVKGGLSRFLSITPERNFPTFSSVPYTTWHRKQGRIRKTSQKKVVLFTDTFNNYNYPSTLAAAQGVMEAAGFEVILSHHGCCGRPMISKGLVDEARNAAEQTVSVLAPLAEAGYAVVGLEPSCILSLRDEYLYLLPGDDRVKMVANQSLLFEEWIVRLSNEGNLDLKFNHEPKKLLVHTHCHTKSLVGSSPGFGALSLPNGYEVQEVDSGCCGMAGAFGYEKEHYDISMQMAERRLLPAVRNHPEDGIVVAAGISCRQQIKHGTGRAALHPAEVLFQALKK